MAQRRKSARERRIEAFLASLRNKGIGGMVVVSPENTRYVTGFTGNEGTLFLVDGRKYLLVSGLYASQARDEGKGCIVMESEDGIREVAELTNRLGKERIGFESRHVRYTYYEQLRKACRPKLVPIVDGLERVRAVKEPGEVRLLTTSAHISSQGFLGVLDFIQPGVEERAVSLVLEHRIRSAGADALPFPVIVASGRRGAYPHAAVTRKKIKKGELVTLDFGAVYRGYCSDETCTIAIGKPSRKQRAIYLTVKAAHDEAINIIKPGIELSSVDAAARTVIEKKGLGRYFRHGTGHGVGLSIHEEPRISPRQRGRVEVGMVFTIEPGVYIPGWGGVRIEDMVVVTKQGCRILSSVPKELISV